MKDLDIVSTTCCSKVVLLVVLGGVVGGVARKEEGSVTHSDCSKGSMAEFIRLKSMLQSLEICKERVMMVQGVQECGKTIFT